MKYLVIDTSTSHLIISLIVNDKIISYYDEIISNGMSEHILPEIENQFKNNNLMASEIDAIFVSIGPGSFTGIRVGLTIAKVYAWSLNIRVVPISSLELLATTSTSEEYIIPLIDARRGYVYTGVYNKDLDLIEKDKHVLFDDIVNKKNCEFVSYDKFDNLNTIEPKIDILKIIKKHENDNGINPHSLNPNYLKLTEAEENLRNKND